MRKILFSYIILILVIFNSYSQNWSSLGSGVNSFINALTVYNNELIAGGSFQIAGGTSANYIAKWNGTSWSPLGLGMNNEVFALTVYNNQLIAGGAFHVAGGVSANYIARWNGSSWAPLGNAIQSFVFDLKLYNNELIACGNDSYSNRFSKNENSLSSWGYISKWNGYTWSNIGESNSSINTLSVYNNQLIAGGEFTTIDGINANRIANWNGTLWSPLGSGMDGSIYALTTYNNELFAGGWFTTAGGVSALFIAEWNGNNWRQPNGGGMDFYVYSLTVYNNELIVGGQFTSAGNENANCIAKWNGTNWASLGSGMSGYYPHINALTEFNNELIAGGWFSTAGGVTAHNIAKWYSPIGIKVINSEISKSYSLSQNYPNPFNPLTHLKFEIPESKFVCLKIYNALGREITTLVNEQLKPGTYEVEWDASNFATGIFFYKLTSENYSETKKMVLIK